MNILDQAKPYDILLSYGGSNKPALKLLHGQIKGAQKKVGYTEYGATHVEMKVFNGTSSMNWASDQAEGVVLHEPTIHADRQYRLIRLKEPISPQGIIKLQMFVSEHIGRKYDKGQLVAIKILLQGWIPTAVRFRLAKIVDYGGKYTFCSGFVYDCLKRAGIELPLPLLFPNRPNPGERAMPALYEPDNHPEYFELVAEQGFEA